MPTFMAVTTILGEHKATELASRIENHLSGVSGVAISEIEDGSGLWEVAGYFDDRPDDVRLALLATACGARRFLISELQETGWVEEAQRQLAPVISGRFFVHGRHDRDKIPAGMIPLAVDAAMAFGTGHHGTTHGCLQAIEKLAESGCVAGRVLDIGCGTAILAMAVAMISDARIVASDVDMVAVETALANIESNGLSDRVRVVHGTGFDHPEVRALSPYDLLLANLLETPLVRMADDFATHCVPDGFAVLSGVLDKRRHTVIARFRAAGFSVHETIVVGEWVTMVLRRR